MVVVEVVDVDVEVVVVGVVVEVVDVDVVVDVVVKKLFNAKSTFSEPLTVRPSAPRIKLALPFLLNL